MYNYVLQILNYLEYRISLGGRCYCIQKLLSMVKIKGLSINKIKV